jgi:hypothetical protein
MEFTVTSTDVGVVALWAMEDLEQGAQCSMSENLKEAGTRYYVVDCATCKAPVPFKHAPEGEPIVCFPTMTVRCFQCHADHTYSPDLISRRKAAPPRGIFNGDRQPSRVKDGNREAARDRQEDRDERDLGVRVISDRKIAPISASLRCNNILNVAARGKRATIFFFSSCFFAAGWVSHVDRLTQLAFLLLETRNKFTVGCHPLSLVDPVSFLGRFQQVPELVSQKRSVSVVGQAGIQDLLLVGPTLTV